MGIVCLFGVWDHDGSCLHFVALDWVLRLAWVGRELLGEEEWGRSMWQKNWGGKLFTFCDPAARCLQPESHLWEVYNLTSTTYGRPFHS